MVSHGIRAVSAYGRALRSTLRRIGPKRSTAVASNEGFVGHSHRSGRGYRGRWRRYFSLGSAVALAVVACATYFLPGQAVAEPAAGDGWVPATPVVSGCPGAGGGYVTLAPGGTCSGTLSMSAGVPAGWSAPFIVWFGIEQTTELSCGDVAAVAGTGVYVGGGIVLNTSCAFPDPPDGTVLRGGTVWRNDMYYVNSAPAISGLAVTFTNFDPVKPVTWVVDVAFAESGDRTASDLIPVITAGNNAVIASQDAAAQEIIAELQASRDQASADTQASTTQIVAVTEGNTRAVEEGNDIAQQTQDFIMDGDTSSAGGVGDVETGVVNPNDGTISSVFSAILAFFAPGTFTSCTSMRVQGPHDLAVTFQCGRDSGLPPELVALIGVISSFVLALSTLYLVIAIGKAVQRGGVDDAFELAQQRLEDMANSLKGR